MYLLLPGWGGHKLLQARQLRQLCNGQCWHHTELGVCLRVNLIQLFSLWK